MQQEGRGCRSLQHGHMTRNQTMAIFLPFWKSLCCLVCCDSVWKTGELQVLPLGQHHGNPRRSRLTWDGKDFACQQQLPLRKSPGRGQSPNSLLHRTPLQACPLLPAQTGRRRGTGPHAQVPRCPGLRPPSAPAAPSRLPAPLTCQSPVGNES